MFEKIVVVLNELPESQRALHAAVELAESLGSSLATVSILGDPSALSSFAIVVDPTAPEMARDARRKIHAELHDRAKTFAQERGLQIRCAVIEGREVEAVLNYLRDEKAELLVLGIHQHDFYLSRLWNSVYDLAKDAPCSVLGVH